MTISPLDDPVLSGVFVSAEVGAVFSTASWLGRLLEVETALARAQAVVGVIPMAAADAIAAVRVDDLNVERLGDRTTIVGFPIVGLIEQLARAVPEGLGQYAHWGATTQDILDTALVLQLREVVAITKRDLVTAGDAAAQLADRHRGTLMLGRSQLQPGLPTTFGLRAAGWLSGLTRHLERLNQIRPRLFVAQLSGAVGTAASLGPAAVDVQARFAHILGLDASPVNWHNQRDSIVEVGQFAAMLAGSLGKIGLDVVLASQFELGELRETPFAPGAGSSSTMPQKQNPILAQRLLHAAHLTRGHSSTMLDALVTDNDRGTGVWPVEWAALPQLMALAASAVGTAGDLLTTVEVDVERMSQNLSRVGDPLMAEAAMMALAPKVGRQRAHEMVAEALVDANQSGLAAAIQHSRHALEAETLAPASYLGTTEVQISNAIEAWRVARRA